MIWASPPPPPLKFGLQAFVRWSYTIVNAPWNRPRRLTSRDRALLTAISTGTPNSFPSVLSLVAGGIFALTGKLPPWLLFKISLLAKSCGVNDWPIVNRRESKTRSRANDRLSGYERSAFLGVTSSETVSPPRHDNGALSNGAQFRGYCAEFFWYSDLGICIPEVSHRNSQQQRDNGASPAVCFSLRRFTSTNSQPVSTWQNIVRLYRYVCFNYIVSRTPIPFVRVFKRSVQSCFPHNYVYFTNHVFYLKKIREKEDTRSGNDRRRKEWFVILFLLISYLKSICLSEYVKINLIRNF